MKTLKTFLVLAILISVGATAQAAYKMTVGVLDSGAAKSSSAAYRLLGKTRDHKIGIPAGTNFKLAEGFLASAYYGQVVFGPMVTAIDPSSTTEDKKVSVTISGANFVSGASAKLSLIGADDIVATDVVFVNSAKITGVFEIKKKTKKGSWNVTVTNPDGRSGSLPVAFTVNVAAPVVSSIDPDTGYNNEVVEIKKIWGDYFQEGLTVKLRKAGENDIIGEDVRVTLPTADNEKDKITCKFNLIKKAVGFWDVFVTNPDGQTGTLPAIFKLQAPEVQTIGKVYNEPNPFNPMEVIKGENVRAAGARGTAIRYYLSKNADVFVYIHTMYGDRVWQYAAAAGTEGGRLGDNEVIWDGTMALKNNAQASAGVYYAYVMSGNKPLAKIKIAIAY